MSKVKANIANVVKYGGIIALFLILGYLANEFQKSTSIDFTKIRNKLTVHIFETDIPKPQIATQSIDEINLQHQRKQYLDTTRARQYIESAIHDYYHGSYEEALHRLERAKIYDPNNYSVFKLTGQIFFERNKFRKAFNNFERATQLPNDDQTLSRDIDVLKRLIRYSRNEIDKLQHTLNIDPDNRLARARLKELEEQMRE